MNVTGEWSPEETERFLDDALVPIRLACRTPREHLWMLSLWYGYEDGRFHCATSAGADVVEYLRHDPHVAFEISTNEPPYRGVRGCGTASVDGDPEKTYLEALCHRYLGGTDSGLARWLLSDEREEVVITVTPERCYTWDFSDRMRDVRLAEQ